jgi:hypothetical protein
MLMALRKIEGLVEGGERDFVGKDLRRVSR